MQLAEEPECIRPISWLAGGRDGRNFSNSVAPLHPAEFAVVEILCCAEAALITIPREMPWATAKR